MTSDLVGLGAWAEPVKALVDRVSDFVGGSLKPTQIKRVARAEAEADAIKAIAKLDLEDEIQRRAVSRLVVSEARKQENIESITYQATTFLKSDAKPQELGEDWIANFFSQCGTISEEEMQTLWAKVLAGEANRPGSFSRRTVNFLATMDKRDAALFTSLAQFIWTAGEADPLLYNLMDPVYTSKGINVQSVAHLHSIGLISRQTFSFVREVNNNLAVVSYFDRTYRLDFSSANSSGAGKKSIHVGHAILSNIGRELLPIAGGAPNEDFHDFIIADWKKNHIKVHSFQS